MEWDVGLAVSPSKYYILEDRVCSNIGKSVSQIESVCCYTAAHSSRLISKLGFHFNVDFHMSRALVSA